MKNEKSNLGLFVTIAILFGIYCFVFGQSGLLERNRLKNERKVLDQEIAYLQKRNQELLELYADYQKGKYNLHEARVAGFAYPGSKKIFFKRGVGSSNSILGVYQGVSAVNSQNEIVKISQLRIIFIAIASLISLILLLRIKFRNFEKERE